MKITRIQIKYFRSIESLDFDPSLTTAICGSNSSGKSNVLRAIRLAFLEELTQPKLSENITSSAGPNAKCIISITFDKPIKELVQKFGIQSGESFVYSISFKRSGFVSRSINKIKLGKEDFDALRDSFLIIYVPAIRDIGIDGLKPFRDTLLYALRKHKGTSSLAALNDDVRRVISERSKAMLSSTKSLVRDWIGVDQLEVDTDPISVDLLLDAVGLRVKFNDSTFELNKLGTGHQSAVVIKLFRELGVGSGRPVIYLFEEPDNHLHPTSIKVVADEISDCVSSGNGQVFLTTHSPYLLNHFEFKNILPLFLDDQRNTCKRNFKITKTDKILRTAMSKFGLKPAEALLSRKVLILEGQNDFHALREFIDLHTKVTPECQDILIVPAGGKAMVAELADLLDEIGANWKAILDRDALEDANQPMLIRGLSTHDKNQISTSIQTIKSSLFNSPTKRSKLHKQLEAMERELKNPVNSKPNFSNSMIAQYLTKKSKLSVANMTKLKSAVTASQTKNINNILAEMRLFVWKGEIEDVVVPVNAETLAETFLLSQSILTSAGSTSDRRNRILSAVKGFAHEPHKMQALIHHLWGHGVYKKQEVIRALQFVLN